MNESITAPRLQGDPYEDLARRIAKDRLQEIDGYLVHHIKEEPSSVIDSALASRIFHILARDGWIGNYGTDFVDVVREEYKKQSDAYRLVMI